MCYEHLLLSLSRAELFHRFVESNLLRLSALQATEKHEETPNSKESSKKSDPGGYTPCSGQFSHVLLRLRVLYSMLEMLIVCMDTSVMVQIL
jgi:hypothetical protein